VAALIGLGVLSQYVAARQPEARLWARLPRWAPQAWRPAAVATAALLLLGLSGPVMRGSLGAGAAQLASTLGTHGLNAVDQEREDRSYYEVLLDSPRSTVSLAALFGGGIEEIRSRAGTGGAGDGVGAGAGFDDDEETLAVAAIAAQLGRNAPREVPARAGTGGEGRMQGFALVEQPFARRTGDMLGYELVPSFSGSYKEATFRINQWGMRDREYALVPPPNTYRIALVASSYTMGGGVAGEQTHEWLLEERLNREGPGAPRRHYEILNFAVGGYGILQNVVVVEQKIFRFQPDAVLLMIHSNELTRMVSYLSSLLQDGAEIPYAFVREKLREAGVTADMERTELRRRLLPVSSDLVRWSYQRVAELCREQGVPLVGVVFPVPTAPSDRRDEAMLPTVAGWAEAAGIPLLSLKGVYNGHDAESVRLSDRDMHLSAHGHRLVAERLFELLRTYEARMLRLGFGSH
jgi:hypothetical protein